MLTNILKTNSARCVIKVYTADFQGVQLRNVVPTDLNTVQNNLHTMYLVGQTFGVQLTSIMCLLIFSVYSTHETLRNSKDRPTATTATHTYIYNN